MYLCLCHCSQVVLFLSLAAHQTSIGIWFVFETKNANTMDFLQAFASSIYHPLGGTIGTLVACMFIFVKLVWDSNLYQVKII